MCVCMCVCVYVCVCVWRKETSETLRERTSTFSIHVFSLSVMSDSLWHHELQHARLLCPSLSSRVCSNSCPLSQWCHPNVSSSVASFSSRSQSFPASGSFQWVSSQSFSFSISPSNECSGLISFRIDWLDLLTVQGTLKSSLAPWFEGISSLVLCLLNGPTLTSVHDYWKNLALTRWTFVS